MKINIIKKEIKRKIHNLTKTQEEFQKRIKTINAKIQQSSKTERNETIIPTEKHNHFQGS